MTDVQVVILIGVLIAAFYVPIAIYCSLPPHVCRLEISHTITAGNGREIIIMKCPKCGRTEAI